MVVVDGMIRKLLSKRHSDDSWWAAQTVMTKL